MLLVFSIAVVGVWCYATIYPFFTPAAYRYEQLPMRVLNSPVHPGGVVEALITRCNDTAYPASASVVRQLVLLDKQEDGLRAITDLDDVRAPVPAGPGCETYRSRLTVVPREGLPDGRYKLVGTTTVTNHWGRTVVVPWETTAFTIQKDAS